MTGKPDPDRPPHPYIGCVQFFFSSFGHSDSSRSRIVIIVNRVNHHCAQLLLIYEAEFKSYLVDSLLAECWRLNLIRYEVYKNFQISNKEELIFFRKGYIKNYIELFHYIPLLIHHFKYQSNHS